MSIFFLFWVFGISMCRILSPVLFKNISKKIWIDFPKFRLKKIKNVLENKYTACIAKKKRMLLLQPHETCRYVWKIGMVTSQEKRKSAYTRFLLFTYMQIRFYWYGETRQEKRIAAHTLFCWFNRSMSLDDKTVSQHIRFFFACIARALRQIRFNKVESASQKTHAQSIFNSSWAKGI